MQDTRGGSTSNENVRQADVDTATRVDADVVAEPPEGIFAPNHTPRQRRAVDIRKTVGRVARALGAPYLHTALDREDTSGVNQSLQELRAQYRSR